MMDKKWWAIIGLMLNLITLIFIFIIKNYFPDLTLFTILIIIAFIFSFILFFKNNKLLKIVAIVIPLIILFFLIKGTFFGASDLVRDINPSVEDKIKGIFE